MLCGTRAHRARWKMKFVPNEKRVASDKLNQIQYNLMYSSVLRLHSDDREWDKNRCRALSYHRSLLLASIYMYCNDNFATMLFRFYEWNVRCIFWYGFGSVGGCVRSMSVVALTMYVPECSKLCGSLSRFQLSPYSPLIGLNSHHFEYQNSDSMESVQIVTLFWTQLTSLRCLFTFANYTLREREKRKKTR